MSKGTNSTVVSNRFIDQFMPHANGAYVKIYLYILRCINEVMEDMSIELIADRLDETEKDILRALSYWEDVGILSVNRTAGGKVTDITILDLDKEENQRNRYLEPKQPPLSIVSDTKPSLRRTNLEEGLATGSREGELPQIEAPKRIETRPTYSTAQVRQLTSSDEMKELLFDLEQILLRPIKPSEIQLVLFCYESLGFSTELIKYLYEYCQEKGKVSNSYVEKVALGWKHDGISSVEAARLGSSSYQENSLAVTKAFGLSRLLAPVERSFLKRWFEEYAMPIPLVTEACNRTVLTIGKPDFKYADKIISNWYQAKIFSLDDLVRYEKENPKSYFSQAKAIKEAQATRQSQPKGTFFCFPQRNYSEEEYLEIEQRMINKQQG